MCKKFGLQYKNLVDECAINKKHMYGYHSVVIACYQVDRQRNFFMFFFPILFLATGYIATKTDICSS